MNSPIKDSLVVSAAVLAIGLGSMAAPLYAQDEPGADDGDLNAVLDEVIVTAQRRAENVQDVPIAMTVFSQEQIANANMTNSGDLATLTPSLHVDTRFGSEMTAFEIRGFYQALRTTASVATYFADVVAPRGQSSQVSGDGAGPGYMFDLQNIQVLKGPQGTLFGRNTTGGAILLTPQEPTDVFEGFVEGTAGNYNLKKLNAVLNVPISDTFKVRLGVEDNKRDGYLNNASDIGASELGNSNYTATRLSLLWNVTDTVENSTIFNYVDSESKGYTAIMFACASSSFIGAPTWPGGEGGCQHQLREQRESGNDGFYDVNSDIATPITTIKEKRVINTTTWDVSDDLTIKNIAAYAHLETENGSAVFGTDFVDPNNLTHVLAPGISVINPDEPVTSQETYVEELQFQGSALDEALTWQAGMYYEHSRPDGYSGNNSSFALNCNLASIEGDPSGFDCYGGSLGALGSVLVQHFKTDYLNKAVYSQATYDFTSDLNLTIGLRYTKDEVTGHGIKDRYTWAGTTPVPLKHTIQNAEVSSQKPTGMINLSWHPVADVMTYAKYSRGYRQGSVNLAADQGIDTHDPETIDAYEIGAKTSFGGPIPGQFNIAIFDNELNHAQMQNGYISATSGPTTAITNAGKATSKGVEIDAAFKLLEDLTLSVSYSHLDTELKDTGNVSPAEITRAIFAATGDQAVADQAALAFSPIAAAGDELPFAPINNWVISLNYLVPVPSDVGVVSLGTTYVYMGRQRAAASKTEVFKVKYDNPYDTIDPYELLNLNASWIGMFGSSFDTSLFVTNAFDKEYVTYYSGTMSALGFEVYQPGQPRMYGMRLRYSFE